MQDSVPWSGLPHEYLWTAVVNGLRSLATHLVDEAQTWRTILPPESAVLDQMERFQSRLTHVDWSCWTAPDQRGGAHEVLARTDLGGALRLGRLLSQDPVLRERDPNRCQWLYRMCDDWHNVPDLLTNVPKLLPQNLWAIGLLEPQLRIATIQHEHTVLRQTLSDQAGVHHRARRL